MNKNSLIIYTTIIAVLIIIIIPTTYTICKRHNDRLLEVSYKRIEEAAKNCYLNDVCLADKITLKELYDNKYLMKESNPVTKEYYKDTDYVLKKNDSYKFITE